MSDKLKIFCSAHWVSVVTAALLMLSPTLIFTSCSGGGDKNQGKAATEPRADVKEVKLSEESLNAAKIETAEVTEEPGGDTLRVTGSVETNQQLTQQVTPLVSGRVERVNVALGDRVRRGAVLAVVSSPQVAEMHGKLHEAETRLALADKSLARVRQPENRVAVLQAKARLDEAEASLRRTQRLIELGAGAGKDLTATETAYKTAKAEYEFQSNISLNREVQQAQAEVETARVEVAHLRNSLRSLGADLPEGENVTVRHDTSLVVLRAPASGTITERLINAGAGIEAGKPLFTVANIANLWVIANVPEAQVKALSVGTTAQVRTAGGDEAITGRVTYLDPLLNVETRTARVRVELSNPSGRLRVGTFVEVTFRTGTTGGDLVLVIPEEAVQRLEERAVVFVPKEEAGHEEKEKKEVANDGHKEKVTRFEVREVELGGVADGMRRVTGGLKAGERVVTKGSFMLKSQLMKGELGEHGH